MKNLQLTLLLFISTLSLSVMGTPCADLFITEYGEPNGGNGKYVEIYNPTAGPIDLSGYELWKISNGGTWPENSFTLSGMIASGGTVVIGNNFADVPSASLVSTSVVNFNGDDAVGLAKAGVLIDAVGTDGADPGSGFDVAGVSSATANGTIIRKSTVEEGNIDWALSAGTDAASSEWIVVAYSQDDTGLHTTACVSGSVDSDGDGIDDSVDNCDFEPNVDQADLDNDGEGDACDTDIDGDGVLNGDDCAPMDALVFEGATCDDGDANTVDDVILADCSCVGTSSTLDTDMDTIPDVDDNCPNTPNTDQADLDGDDLGDVCDNDIDGDGVLNVNDCDPMDATLFEGATCDDGDPITIGDVIQADCTCLGFGPSDPCTELFISEYGEPSSGNGKYLEIHNPTQDTVDLSTYEIWKISNGGNWPEQTFSLTGTIAPEGNVVIGNNDIDVPSATLLSSGVINFNGDDAMGLANNGFLIDAIGTDGPDPGSGWDAAGVSNATQNKTMLRKSSVLAPTVDWIVGSGTDASDSEWIVIDYTQDYLTMHGSECSGPVDTDGDGVFDNVDNCVLDMNADQADLDSDGEGDACDDDIDGDGDLNATDCDPLDAAIFAGATCDDGDPMTVGDIIRSDCSCAGFGPGSDCSLAITVTAGVTTSPGVAAIGGATATNACFDGASNAVWYSYTSTVCDTVTITSSIDPDLPATRVSVHSACDMIDCITSDDDSGEGFTSVAKFLAQAGTTYLIEWDDRWSDGEFDFEISVPGGNCDTDFNNDDTTNGDDFSIFLGNFGLSCVDNCDCPTDLNKDGVTDGEDFSVFLGNYGLDCPPSE